MDYPRPPYTNRSPPEPEHQRSTWDPIPRHHYSTVPPIQHQPPPLAHPSSFDPESEDSDVSLTPGENNIALAQPNNLPLPPQHALDSSDAILAHLNELSRVEDQNIRKQNWLKEKRARKDEKIRARREVQDAKYRAIMDARARRDARIERRRHHEDAAFQKFHEDLEDEENRFRHRLKRLKRGLPVDESTPVGRSLSSASMSPPGPAYSTIPPPAKRHQTGPPGQSDSPIMNTPRDHRQYPPNGSTGPSYSFYQTSQAQQSPYPLAYHPGPMYNSSPQQNPAGTSLPPLRTAPPPEPNPLQVNGQPASPQTSRPPQPPNAATPNTLPPPRQASTNYDIRPPPSSGMGFAPINHPPPAQPGFAAINSRTTNTPPPHAGLAKDGPPMPLPLPRANEYTPSRPFAADVNHSGSVPPVGSGNKRTPSTTHPYQMSEAFANRHHHCERTDSLNRGIWTWYGPGGTQENPTSAPVQMYLKCNHDGCGRIDWRTVHGLQCHIVKNHEQPKGTIGSLEKALEKYGVSVKDIEEIEKRDGLGSGGTMADPKNLKMKAKARDNGERRDSDRKSTPASSGPTPTSFHTNPPMSYDSPAPSTYAGRPFAPRSGLGREDSHSSGTDGTPSDTSRRPTGQASSGFAAVNTSWSGVSSTPSKVNESRDQDMADAQVMKAEDVSASKSSKSPSTKPFWPNWKAQMDMSKPPIHSQTKSPTAPQHNRASSGGWSAEVAAKPPTASPKINVPLSPQAQAAPESQKVGADQEPKVQPDIKPTPQHHEATPLSTNEVKNSGGDVQMGGTDELQHKEVTNSLEPNRSTTIVAQTKPTVQPVEKPEEDEQLRAPPGSSDGVRSAIQSPEMSSKRMGVGSRRGSRRSSMAATTSKTTSEKDKEDVIDEAVEAEKDGDSAQEDDENTITVVGTSITDKPKDKEVSDRTRTRQGRQATGRYGRKTRQN